MAWFSLIPMCLYECVYVQRREVKIKEKQISSLKFCIHTIWDRKINGALWNWKSTVHYDTERTRVHHKTEWTSMHYRNVPLIFYLALVLWWRFNTKVKGTLSEKFTYVYVCICVLKSVCCTSSSLFSFCNVPWMWKYWERMKGGTPSCIIVTIPQAHLHLALYVRLKERDDTKTPARVLKQESKTTLIRTYSPPFYMVAR